MTALFGLLAVFYPAFPLTQWKKTFLFSQEKEHEVWHSSLPPYLSWGTIFSEFDINVYYLMTDVK